MDNIIKFGEEKTKELLDNLGTKYEEVTVSYDKETNVCSILIKGDDLGILIGYHGKNLDSLKVMLSLMINKELGRDNAIRIIININDYSEKRTAQLLAMLENAKTVMAAREKNSYAFPPMSPADRRIIHTLAQEMGLKTESEGEGRDRHVNLVSE